MRASLGGMGGSLDTGGRLGVVRMKSGGEGADCRVERMLGLPSSSVCGGSVALVLTGVDGVPESGRLRGERTVAPTFGDAASSLACGMVLLFGGEVGVWLGDVLVESEAAAKPWTSSLVRGVSRVIVFAG